MLLGPMHQRRLNHYYNYLRKREEKKGYRKPAARNLLCTVETEYKKLLSRVELNQVVEEHAELAKLLQKDAGQSNVSARLLSPTLLRRWVYQVTRMLLLLTLSCCASVAAAAAHVPLLRSEASAPSAAPSAFGSQC